VGQAVSIFKDHQCCAPPASQDEARNSLHKILERFAEIVHIFIYDTHWAGLVGSASV
jgi:hypothetical protein